MVKTLEKVDEKTGEKSIEIDKRSISKVEKPPNIKHLKFSRILPIKCNECPYRPQGEGGLSEFDCTEYEEDALCSIRKDVTKAIKLVDGERNADRALSLLQSQYEDTFEKLKFYELLEDQQGTLNPEVTKRINANNNTFKILNEASTKKQSVEVTEKKTLSEDMKQQIIEQTFKITKEVTED